MLRVLNVERRKNKSTTRISSTKEWNALQLTFTLTMLSCIVETVLSAFSIFYILSALSFFPQSTLSTLQAPFLLLSPHLRPSMKAETIARLLDRLTQGFIYSTVAFCTISTPFLIVGYVQKYNRIRQSHTLVDNGTDQFGVTCTVDK